jgi:hypothetical protein
MGNVIPGSVLRAERFGKEETVFEKYKGAKPENQASGWKKAGKGMEENLKTAEI